MNDLFGQFIMWAALPFVCATIYFGIRKGGYYDTELYDGDGTAHKVLK